MNTQKTIWQQQSRRRIIRTSAISLLLMLQLGCGSVAGLVSEYSDGSTGNHSGEKSSQGIIISGIVKDDAATVAVDLANDPNESTVNSGDVTCKKYDGVVLASGSINDAGVIVDVVIPVDALDSTRQVICQAVNHDGQKLLGHYDLTERVAGDEVVGDIDIVTTRAIQQILSQCGEATSFDELTGCSPKIATGVIQPTELFEAYKADDEVLAETESGEAAATTSGGDSTPPVAVADSTEIGSFTAPTFNRHGLVAYYPFNGNAQDVSGNKNDGTVSGAQLTVDKDGNASSAYHFNGQSDYIRVASSPSLDIQHAITMSAWVLHDSTRSAQDIINKTPLHFPYNNLGGYRLSAWWANPNGYACELYDGAHDADYLSQHIVYAYDGLAGDVTKNPLVGTWTHVVSTWDGKTLTLYRDGKPQHAVEFTGSIAASDGDLFIGMHPWMNQGQFDGTIDEVTLFDRALSATEVHDLMEGHIAPFTATINIRPWNPANPIYLHGTGQVPVAILSTSTFAADSEMDQQTITFGRTGDEASLNSCEARDVNRDGLVDLVCYFDNQTAAFQVGDTTGMLKGKTAAGMFVIGNDDILIVE